MLSDQRCVHNGDLAAPEDFLSQVTINVPTAALPEAVIQ
jgi:hypothetical protein